MCLKIRKWPAFTGDCEQFAKFLEDKKTYSPWIAVKFADALLRGYGQIMLSNNPLSGFLILIGICIGSPLQAVLGLITGIIGLIWSAVIGQSSHLICAGETTFNPILFGNFVVKAMPEIFQSGTFGLWLAIIFGSLLCVYAHSALSGVCSKWNVPCFTLSFILVEYILVLSVVHPNGIAGMYFPTRSVTPAVPGASPPRNYTNSTENTLPSRKSVELPIPTSPTTNTSDEATSDRAHTYIKEIASGDDFQDDDIHHVQKTPEKLIWGKVFSGMVTASSHVLGVESIPMASLIYLGVFLYSPTMGGFSFLGACLGTLTGILYSNGNYDKVYAGLWGYNGFLTGAATVGLGFVVTIHTSILTVVTILFATCLQHVLNLVFADSILLMYNLPFVFACMLMFCISISTEDLFPKPLQVSFPEKQTTEYKKHKKIRSVISDSEDDALVDRTKRVTLVAAKEFV